MNQLVLFLIQEMLVASEMFNYQLFKNRTSAQDMHTSENKNILGMRITTLMKSYFRGLATYQIAELYRSNYFRVPTRDVTIPGVSLKWN